VGRRRCSVRAARERVRYTETPNTTLLGGRLHFEDVTLRRSVGSDGCGSAEIAVHIKDDASCRSRAMLVVPKAVQHSFAPGSHTSGRRHQSNHRAVLTPSAVLGRPVKASVRV